jgi:polyketide synthase 3/4
MGRYNSSRGGGGGVILTFYDHTSVAFVLQVLVHAGTGGVGLSAVQVSKAMGASVVATAGSASKRGMLRQMGVATAVGSRDTAFATTLAPSGEI